MQCKICGNESGKYPFCYECNQKKKQGTIIKCPLCQSWHYKDTACPPPLSDQRFIYEVKHTLLSAQEQAFFHALREAVPQGYLVFPQINLAAFIEKTDSSTFRNELFRNVDFLITTTDYQPRLAVEINDSSHLTSVRQKRDITVSHILEEAGIPLLRLWTSYGINQDYIRKSITSLLNTPVIRKKYSNIERMLPLDSQENHDRQAHPPKKRGCYIATCVYGSYDCPSVWTLRRFRDNVLAQHIGGRCFIKCYYAISPILVRILGKTRIFQRFWKYVLDKFVAYLHRQGISDRSYQDKE